MKKKAGPERVAFLAQLAHLTNQPELGKLYGMAMKAVARKSVVRLDRDTKARFCKQCSAPRSPLTTTWRKEDLSKRQNRPMMIATCRCGAVSRRPMYSLPSPRSEKRLAKEEVRRQKAAEKNVKGKGKK